MTAVEARAFMRRLADYVADNHLKRGSEQRGMIYEYLDVDRRGKPDQFVEGEAKGFIPSWWANGVEQERYSIQVGNESHNLFLASSEQSVKAWMAQELAGGQGPVYHAQDDDH